MTGDIRNHLAEVPFQPFTIHMADGRHIHVPSLDHIKLTTARATVIHDDGTEDILPGLLMAGLTIHTPTSTKMENDS